MLPVLVLLAVLSLSASQAFRSVDYVSLCSDSFASDEACYYDQIDESCTEIGVRTSTYAIRYTSNQTLVTPEDCLYFALSTSLEETTYSLTFEYPLLCYANGTQTRAVFSIADSGCRFEFTDFAPTQLCVGSQRVYEATFTGSTDRKICMNSAFTFENIFYGNPETCFERDAALKASWLYPDETCSPSPVICPNPEVYTWNSKDKVCEPVDDCGFFGAERNEFRNVVYNDTFYAERSHISCDYQKVQNEASLWVQSLNGTGYLEADPSGSLYISSIFVDENGWSDFDDIESANAKLVSHVLLAQNSSVLNRVGSRSPFNVTARAPKNIALGQLPEGGFAKNVQAAFNRTFVNVRIVA